MRALAAVLLLGTVLAAAWWLNAGDPEEPAGVPPPGPGARAVEPLPDAAGFVGSESCRACHERNHATWLRTAHAYSLRPPDPDTVAGAFDGRRVESTGFRATPRRVGDVFLMDVEGLDGRPSGTYRVSHVVGRAFEQAYLYTDGDGRWRVLPLCWSLERGEWDATHLVLADIAGQVGVIPDDYDSRTHVFNTGCGQCHATDYDVGHDPVADRFDSTFLEGAVACESCHGPGSVHVAFHRQERDARDGYGSPARLLHPRHDLDAAGVAASCGRCHYLHEWRSAIEADPRVGHREIAVSMNHDRSGFFVDGRISGLNYHGTTQAGSACYREGGMSCLDCHRLHGGRKWALRWAEDDDAQCAQCHADVAESGTGHTFHEDVRCVDCHMPKLMDGVLHFMRDHSIGSPEPELTERFGAERAPNACNACHDDRGAAWARAAKEDWWGPAPRRRVEDVALVAALRDDPVAVPSSRLAATAARAESAHFVRMTAILHLTLRDDADARAGLRAVLSDDGDPERLALALRGVASRPVPPFMPHLLPLLEHDVRTVRVEAAHALARCGWYGATPALARAASEAEAMLERRARTPDQLARVALIADAARDAALLGRVGPVLAAAAREPSPPILDALIRFGRSRADRGEHERALSIYARVDELAEGRAPDLLALDAAESLVALGGDEAAASNWRVLVERSHPEGVLSRIASARLAAADGRTGEAVEALETLRARLEDVPGAAHLLRRVRSNLAQIR